MANVSLARLQKVIQEHRFALAAFLIPVGVRSVPEIIVGSYPVGFDTIAFYAPTTLDWASGTVGAMKMLGTAPLLYMISVPLHVVFGLNVVGIFKVMGPTLYGILIWAQFRFLWVGLGWSKRRALGGALLTSLYFVTLRISWDLDRTMLGLTFLLLALPLFHSQKSLHRKRELTLLLSLAVLSNPLTGVISLFLLGRRALSNLMARSISDFLALTKAGAPVLALFFTIVYASLTSGGNVFRSQPNVPTLEGVSLSVGFLGYAYLPIIPLAVMGFRVVKNSELKSWSAICLGGALTGLLPFIGPIALSYRWSLALDIPLCVYATMGLLVFNGRSQLTSGSVEWFRKRALPFASVLIVLSAALYLSLPASQAMFYYSAYPSIMPSSMIQDTVPLSDMGSLEEALRWVATDAGPETALITHQAIYGWARAYLPDSVTLLNYGFSSPVLGVEMAKSLGYSDVLMVWWDNGSGWHDQPYVPGFFAPMHHVGNLVVYRYALEPVD